MSIESHSQGPRSGLDDAELERVLRAGFARDEQDGPLSVLEAVRRRAGIAPRVSLNPPIAETDDAPPLVPLAPDATPRGRANYQMLGELARGGMGTVLRAHDTDLGRDVALKVLHAGLEQDPGVLQRFIEEAQIGGQLQHPGVVPVYEMGLTADERPYFTMKLVKGRTLSALLRERARPDAELRRFLSIFEQACQALAYAHSRGVIHRDLKPSNVMVGAFGEVQLVDWGLAKVLRSGGVDDEKRAQRDEPSVIRTVRSGSDSGSSRYGSVMGTPSYMAPEQARGEIDHVDERSDVFAMGAILCEILTGKPPYTGDDVLSKARGAKLAEALARLEGCGADEELVAIAVRCLTPDRDERFVHAQALAEALLAYSLGVDERARAAQLEAAQAQVRADAARKQRKLALALAAVVLFSSAGYLLLESERRTRRDLAGAEVQSALEQGQLARGRGDNAQALAAAERAESLTRTAGLDGDLLARAAALAADARAAEEAAQAELARQAEAERFRAEVDRIVGITTSVPQAPERTGPAATGPRGFLRKHSVKLATLKDENFSRLFRSIGADLATDQDAEIVETLRRAGVAVEAALAFDLWAPHALVLASPPARQSPARLCNLAQSLDPDPLRARMRSMVASNDRSTLQASARAAPSLSESALSAFVLAQALLNLGDRDTSTIVLRDAVRRFPGDSKLTFALAENLLELSPPQPEEALEYARAARALAPTRVTGHQLLGRSLTALGRLDEAVEAFRTALASEPESTVLLIGLGAALNRKGEYVAAEDAYRRALEIDPRDPVIHYNLGVMAHTRKAYEEAVRWYESAVVLNPDDIFAIENLASCRETLGDLRGAADAYELSIQIDPNRTRALSPLGFALRELGQIPRAIEVLKHSLSIDDAQPNAHLNLGNCYLDQGLFDEAVGEYERALELDPRLAKAASNMGQAHVSASRFDQAIAWFRRALELDPSYATAHLNLAGALESLGRYREAIEPRRTAVQLLASNPQRLRAAQSDLRVCEEIADSEQRLTAVLLQPTSVSSIRDALLAAKLGYGRRMHAGSAGLYEWAFARQPALADDMHSELRYWAALSAVLAGTGNSADVEPLDEPARRRLRDRGRAWLEDDLRVYEGWMESDAKRSDAVYKIGWWTLDADLAHVRSESSISRLPADEAELWRAFWARASGVSRNIPR